LSSADEGNIVLWRTGIRDLLSRACEIAGRNFSLDEWRRFFADEPYHITCPIATAVEADELALRGDSAGARRLFVQAAEEAIRTYGPEANNEVCWIGSLDRFAAIVIGACEQAVEQAVEQTRDALQSMNYRDSRGLARALTGDSSGAIQDFSAFLTFIRARPELGVSENLVRHRENLIAALKAGRNPFNEELLSALRLE
jgi:hypothetical protein